MRCMLLELRGYSQKDWHQHLGSGVHANAIMDGIIHSTIRVETGTDNMRDHTGFWVGNGGWLDY